VVASQGWRGGGSEDSMLRELIWWRSGLAWGLGYENSEAHAFLIIVWSLNFVQLPGLLEFPTSYLIYMHT
jgi:hypothetical protein